MIRKLRRRFIAVNMTILTCVLLAVLTAVFLLMYRSEVRMSGDIMDSVMAHHAMQPPGEDAPPPEQTGTMPMGATFGTGLAQPLHEVQPGTEATTTTTFAWGSPGFVPNPWYGWYPPCDPNNFYRYDHWGWIPQYPEAPKPQDPKPEPAPQVTTTAPVTTRPQPERTKPKQPDPIVTTAVATTARPVVTTAGTTTVAVPVRTTAAVATQSTVITKRVTTTTTTTLSAPPPMDGGMMRNSIYVKLRDDNVIENISAQFAGQGDPELVSRAVQDILKRGDREGTIKVDDVRYRYRMTPEDASHTYSIVLLDRSIELSTLSRLLFIFIIIGGVSLLLLFGISILLANWTIKPVELAWNKQKQFVADASHELKTPLAVISANTDVILANPEGTVREQAKWLSYIKDETTRMTKLVGNLLFIAKSDSKQAPPTMRAFDLSDLVASVVLVFEPMIYEQEKTLDAQIQPKVSYVGDQDRIKQLLTILLDNAVVHSAEHAHITVALTQDCQQKIRLAVSNTANDIPADQLNKLFDRFYRLDESRAKNTGGSGLGLNIAQTIVHCHGGTIAAYSENGVVSFVATL